MKVSIDYIGVVILNYNSWNDTYLCIDSLSKSDNFNNLKIYIIDNNSLEKPSTNLINLVNEYTNIKTIFNTENNGYSAGNNVGLQKAFNDGCNYFLISNSDVIFEQNSIRLLYEYLSKNTNVGIVGPMIYNSNNQTQEFGLHFEGNLKNKYKSVLNKLSFNTFFRQFNIKKSMSTINYNQPKEMFYVSGCCFMFNRTTFEKIYPLDESFFLFYEEYNLGFLLSKLKLKTIYLPQSHIQHNEGMSTKKIGINSYIYFIQSEFNYFVRVRKSPKMYYFPLYFYRVFVFLNKIIFRKNAIVYIKKFRKEMLKIKKLECN